MLVVPAIQAATFWLLLRPPTKTEVNNSAPVKNIAIIELNNNVLENVLPEVIEVKLKGVKAKLKFIPKLAGFIAPLVIVFIFEYICVSGLVSSLGLLNNIRKSFYLLKHDFAYFCSSK